MRKPIPARTTAEIVQRLTAEVHRIEDLHHHTSDEVVTSGCAALDRLLPNAGLRRGTLVEWLADGAGSGAATLALIAAREACRQGGVLAVLDAERSFYPPAAAALQVDLEKLLIVRPPNRRDDSWALDQLLRSRAVAAVMAWPGDWDEHTFRRLQLAVEAGQGLGLLVRPGSVRADPSWAELRLLVEPLATRKARHSGRRWRLEIARIRGGPAGRAVEVELDEQAGTLYETRAADSVHLASPLAAPAPRRRSRGA